MHYFSSNFQKSRSAEDSPLSVPR